MKSLYANIYHHVVFKAIKYWTEKLINEIPLLRRFTKTFILEGLSRIFKLHYFFINNYFYYQTKGVVMGTIFVTVGSN